MTRFSWLLLLASFSLPAAGKAEIRMEVTAGLGGQAVSGRASEFKVRLYATSATQAELQFSDANGDTSIALSLDARREQILWFPVTPAAPGPIKLRLLPAGAEPIVKELILDYRDTPITLVSRSIPGYRVPGGHAPVHAIRPVIVSPAGLPRHFQAYAGVQAIVTDLESLSGLSARQYRAFAKYLGGCNILLLSGAAPAMLDRVRNLSGCGGAFVQGFQTLAQVYPLLQGLTATPGIEPPSAQGLLSLQLPGFRGKMAASLSLYLAGYVIFIALVNWRLKKTQYLSVLPVIVAAAGILAWSGSGASLSVSWVEARSGDSHSLKSTLLLLGGNRRGEVETSVADDVSLSTVDGDPQRQRIRYASAGARRELSVSTSLLLPAACRLGSVERQLLPFALHLKQGLPELLARTESATGEARLLWQGYTYEVPVLAKGETWHPHERQEKRFARSAEEKLLQQSLAFDSPALLLPYTAAVPGLAASRHQQRGWLVIRHDPGQLL